MKRASEARRWAEARGLTLKQYRKLVTEHLRKLFRQMIPFRRCGAETLWGLLQGERLKSLFETGTSSGLVDPNRRALVENELFGIPKKDRHTVRPAYGYLHPDESGRVLGDEVWPYGDIAVRFKSDILERTTFTGGDSLDQISRNGSQNLLARVVPDPVRHPTWLSFPWPLEDVLQYQTAEELVRALYSVSPTLHYIEAQYQGDVTLADAHEVIFLKKPPSEEPLRRLHEEIRRRLNEEGIPYREAWQTESNGPKTSPDQHEDGGAR